MYRRCVICGKKQPDDVDDNPDYYYPKTKDEARIWQQSLNAQNISIDALQKYSCVCLKHIQEFSDHVTPAFATNSEAGSKRSSLNRSSIKSNKDSTESCKPSVGVLLMTGATLPNYLGKSCFNDESCPNKDKDKDKDKHEKKRKHHSVDRANPYNRNLKSKNDVKVSKKNDSDTDICVLESNFSDNGFPYPEPDDTEFTIRRCSLAPEKKDSLSALDKEIEMVFVDKDETNEGGCQCKNDDITDVLVLGKSCDERTKDECPCKNEGCVDDSKTAKVCCPPGCQPIMPPPTPPPERTGELPCGCECEEITRTEMNVTINQQKLRIHELELLLNRQNIINMKIFGKVDELHQAFQQLNPDTEIEARKRREDEELDRQAVEKKQEQAMLNKNPSMLFDSLAKQKNKSDKRKPQFEETDNTTHHTKNHTTAEEDKDKPSFLKKIQYMMTKNPESKKRRTRTQGLVATRDERDPVTGAPSKSDEKGRRTSRPSVSK